MDIHFAQKQKLASKQKSTPTEIYSSARQIGSCANARFGAYVRNTPALNRVYVHEPIGHVVDLMTLLPWRKEQEERGRVF